MSYAKEIKFKNYELKRAHPVDACHYFDKVIKWIAKEVNFTEKVNIKISIEVE